MHTFKQLLSGELKGTKELRLSSGLTEFPEEIFSLSETLEVLDLSQNKLSALPEDFGRLSKLRIAFFSDNLFTEFPSVLANCAHLTMIGFKSNQISVMPENAFPQNLRWLILTNNKIKKLPGSIGNCLSLQKVALAGNQLKSLPPEMALCRNLELLRISANELDELPEWLLEMPKLSWLAFSGNPFSYKPEVENKLQEINWSEFDLKELLGEGASGHIYKAIWETNKTEVAIKVFKGEVTSDGYPGDEMRASIAAGIHPGLVRLLGEIKNHPQEKQGLVMALIPATYTNLGMPPSFETCSRDTFKKGTVFTSEQIYKIVTAVASTAKHLHAKGINHGDLYAHNTLITKEADTLMSDFGAASFYYLESSMYKKMQQIECRALGCLIDDLLMHLEQSDSNPALTEFLDEIKTRLMQDKISQRPLFDKVVEELTNYRDPLSGISKRS